MRRAAIAAGLLAAFATAAGPALAFDCAKAASRAEKAICADPAAKRADDALNAAFEAVRAKLEPAQRTALLANQRNWLKQREATCLLDDAPGVAGACFRTESETRTGRLLARPGAGPGTPGELLPVFVERAGGRRAYEVSVMLYRFARPGSAAERRLNAIVDKELAEVPNRTDEDTDPFTYSFDRQARIAYASDRLLSVAITGSDYTGGAHPSGIVRGVSIDMRDGRELAIGDLFAPDKLAEPRKLCRDQVAAELTRRMREDAAVPDKDPESEKALAEMIAGSREGVDGGVGDLKSWSFGERSATVSFVSSEIAPYALGDFECDFPYETLRPIAKPGFPLP